jgi:putative transferase (TIGR04331 family)
MINSDRVFLATTALEEFWDTTNPMIFLGEWCRLYNRKSYWEPLGGQVMETPWSERNIIIQAAVYVDALYERLLPVLSDAMNSLHGVSHSVRYWRILLGPWLQLYLSVVYDRYICIQEVYRIYPEMTTKVLAEDSWITPADTLEYVKFIKDDPYNLQIFSRLLKLMGKGYPSKNMQVTSTPFNAVSKTTKIVSVVAVGTHATIKNIARLKHNKVIFTKNSYFARSVSVRLFLKSKCTVLPLLEKPVELKESHFETSLRNNIVGSSWVKNEFEHLLSNMISMDIPLSFLEGFNTIKYLASEIYPERVHAIFSANSWYYDEIFKQWAASSAEKNTYLLGVQHGGNYGSILLHSSEDHEVAITDRYYTWGWTRNNSGTGSVVPMPAAKLIGRKPIGADNLHKGILYVATSLPRYLLQFPYIPMFFEEYLEWQTRFVKQISRQIIPDMRVRLHREELGWDIGERWNTYFPEIAKDGWETTYSASLQKCRLYISDNLQTTFIEGLAVNKPGILFWNPLHNPLRPEAQSYYDQLRSVGILHDSPEDAANVVNEIYTDVESWWNEPQRQSARRIFCERFAQTSPNAVEEWVAELKQVTNSNTDGLLINPSVM